MKKRGYILFLAFLLVMPVCFAKQGHMTLLAVRENGNGFNGSVADLYLEIEPGSGRVFLDTFPLTKVDTQISTRFAKDIACNYLDEDCNKFDFFYTIRSDSSIVGGPSAGAAITFLTIALLEDIPVDESATVTGTINSGGIVGPVGGLRAKIEAASSSGLKKVLIPVGSVVKEGNFTVDVSEYGAEKGVDVVEVSTIEDMIAIFTGKPVEKEEGDISVDESYNEIMKGLSIELCGKGSKLKSDVIAFGEDVNLTKADELYELGTGAFESGLYYSSASYCYGANVKYRLALYGLQNLTDSATLNIIKYAQRDIEELKKRLEEAEIQTITDLETVMVVTERLIEGEKYIDEVLENVSANQIDKLAFGMERIYSAYSWYQFFVHAGRKLVLDEEALKDSCQSKISEAEERYQYALLFLTTSTLDSTKEGIQRAYKDFSKGDYALCLFKASKAKAEADVILSVFNTEESSTDILVQQKLDVAKRSIFRQMKKDVFPVLGYSYYQYANSLKEDDQFSSLLYAEYALELSSLDIYFREKTYDFYFPKLNVNSTLIFIWGLSIGFVLGFLLFKKCSPKKGKAKKSKKNKKKKKKNKKR